MPSDVIVLLSKDVSLSFQLVSVYPYRYVLTAVPTVPVVNSYAVLLSIFPPLS